MKKFISLIMAFAVIFAIAGCTGKPAANFDDIKQNEAVEETELALLKNQISAEGKLMGVAYLGWFEGDMETACKDLAGLYAENIPFVKDINKYAENEGYRMYLIVPADDSVSISVSKCAFDEEYLPFAGEKLLEANEPILVRGNVSDTIPNIYVIAERGFEKVCYTPAQSGMDGRLENSENIVYDFTPYELLPEFTVFDIVPDMVFCGDWMCFTKDGNGEERALNLSIEPDGAVKYTYGIVNSEVLEQYEGTWSLENDILKFEFIGGQLESIENPVVIDPHDCIAFFEWDVDAEGLMLKHIDGDEIIYGTKGRTFEFFVNEY